MMFFKKHTSQITVCLFCQLTGFTIFHRIIVSFNTLQLDTLQHRGRLIFMTNMLLRLSSGMKLEHIVNTLLHTTFRDAPVKWAYPLFRGWFDMGTAFHLIGYLLLFCGALVMLLAFRHRKNVFLWCLLYAAEAFSLLLTITTNCYFVNQNIFPDPLYGLFSYIAAFAYIGLSIASIVCHIFIKKTK